MKDARWMKSDNRTNVIVTICAQSGFSQALPASEMQFHNIEPRNFRCWLAAVSQLWAIVGNIIPPRLERRRFQCRLAAVRRLCQRWQYYSAIVGETQDPMSFAAVCSPMLASCSSDVG